MASRFWDSVEKLFFVGQLIFATVAIQAPRNSRETSGRLTRNGASITASVTANGLVSIEGTTAAGCSVTFKPSLFTISTSGDFNSLAFRFCLREAQENKAVLTISTQAIVLFRTLKFIECKTTLFLIINEEVLTLLIQPLKCYTTRLPSK